MIVTSNKGGYYHMEYEIVNLDKKIVVGVGAYISNDDPNMGQVIGDLWKKFFQEGICNTVQNRANEHAIGLYSDYTQQGYHVLTGVEVSELNNSDLVSRVIPAGTYAKFCVHGNMETAVRNAWEKIWNMDLDRTFTGDFEEYLNDDYDHADINLYIAIKK